MKLKYFIVPGIIYCALMSSCLKDKPFLDVTKTAPVISFGLSPASGVQGPFLYNNDTAGAPVADTSIALVLSSPQVLTKDVTVMVKLDPSQITAFNTENDTTLAMLPANLYTLTDTVLTIPAGYRVGRVHLHLNFPGFSTPHFFGLPLVITGTNDSQTIVSGNSSTFMWLFEQ